MIKSARSTRRQFLVVPPGPTDQWLQSLKRKGGEAYRRLWNLTYSCNPLMRKEALCPQLIRW